MAGELAAVNGVAGAREAVGDEPHLGRRSAQAMNQQHAQAPAAYEVATVRQVLVGHLLFPTRYVAMHAIVP